MLIILAAWFQFVNILLKINLTFLVDLSIYSYYSLITNREIRYENNTQRIADNSSYSDSGNSTDNSVYLHIGDLAVTVITRQQLRRIAHLLTKRQLEQFRIIDD